MNPSAEHVAVHAAAWKRHGHQFLAGAGRSVRTQGSELLHAAAVIGTVLASSLRPSSWTRTVRRAFAEQVMNIGIEPLAFVGTLAVFVGMTVVVQLGYWVGESGQSQLLGPLLVTVVARELGPLLINLVVIIRSGSAMTTELGVLKIDGDVAKVERSDRDPLLLFVMPRVLGMAVATFCLTIVFTLVALASGFLFAAWMGKGTRDIFLFADALSRAIQPKDILNIAAKSVLPALFVSASCCLGGLGVGTSFKGLPGATQRALTRSVAGLFIISAGISLLTYL